MSLETAIVEMMDHEDSERFIREAISELTGEPASESIVKTA